MSSDRYKDLLGDIVKEINIIAADPEIWEENEFYQGYRGGMMVIMKAIQDEIAAFGLSDSIEFLDVDNWFRGGGE